MTKQNKNIETVSGIIALLFLFFLGTALYKDYKDYEEHVREQGERKIMIVQRSTDGTLISCIETYDKYIYQSNGRIFVQERFNLPANKVDVLYGNTYAEIIDQNNLQECFTNDRMFR